MDFAAIAKENETKVIELMDSDSEWKPSKTMVMSLHLNKSLDKHPLKQHNKTNQKILHPLQDVFKMECKSSTDFSGYMYRSKGTLNASFEECFKHLDVVPGSPRYDWDSDINKYEAIQLVDSDTRLLWTVSNSLAMGMISPRDLVQVVRWKKTDDVVQFTAKSVELESQPPKEKIVRAQAFPWGIRVVKDVADPKKCHVTILVQLDLAGKLPKTLVDSSLASIQASMNKKYLNHLKKVGVLQK